MDNIDKLYVSGLRDGMNYVLDLVSFIKMVKYFDSIGAPKSSGYSLGCAVKLLLLAEEIGVNTKELKYIIKLI